MQAIEIARKWLHDARDAPPAPDGTVMTLDDAETSLGELERLALAAGTRQETQHTDGSVSRWLRSLMRAARALNGVTEIPSGTARFAVLMLTATRVEDAQQVLLKETPDRGIAALSRRTAAIGDAIAHAIAPMHEQCAIEITRTEHTGDADKEKWTITNRSPAVLRQIRITTHIEHPPATLDYLESHKSATIIGPHDHSGPRTQTKVHWQARTLDGRTVAGTVQVSEAPQASPEPQSATTANTEIVARIARQCGASTHANPVLLEGGSAHTRSLILDALSTQASLTGWTFARCTLKDAVKAGPKAVLHAIGNAIVNAAQSEHAEREATPSAHEHEDAATQLTVRSEQALAAAAPKRIMLVLTDADTLCETNTHRRCISPLDNVRALLHREPRLGLILAGGNAMRIERQRYDSALFGLGVVVALANENDDATNDATMNLPRWPFGDIAQAGTAVVACPEHFAGTAVSIVEIPPGQATTLEGPTPGSRIEAVRTTNGETLALWLTEHDGREAGWSETQAQCAGAGIATARTAASTHDASVRAIDRALLATARTIEAQTGRTPTLLLRIDTENARATGGTAIYIRNASEITPETPQPHRQ